MISSTARNVASRMSARVLSRNFTAASRPALLHLESRQQPVFFALRHFSAPPSFIDPSEALDRIVTVVKNFDQVDPSKVTPDTKFADDLGLDSLDIVEVVMAIEDEFAIEIPDQEADKISSIKEAVDYISSHPAAK